jgi:hypothetical protein
MKPFLLASSHIDVSLPAPYWIKISSNSGDITQKRSDNGTFCLASFILAADIVFSTLDVVRAIPFQAVPQRSQSSTVSVAFQYSHNTSAST